ncbi:MAG TPA: triose-phosphate isomerase [Bacteroidales bacterium]|mgnify:FL=1|nr:triose-phosphate isomerase [Bacteroidales bacterium]
MRKKIVAGNWKMNKTYQEAISLINEIINATEKLDIKSEENKLIIIAPPFPYLQKAVEMTAKTLSIKIAAQNCHSEEQGAFTGEIAANALQSLGVAYVIIGHSERRTYFNESNEFLAKKVNVALQNKLTPIFCCGELLLHRQENTHFDIIKKQLHESIFHLSKDDFRKIIIAYEPVWAIGTGVTATSEQAQEMHAYIRNLIKDAYSNEIADNTPILYGGSCNSKNAKELFANIDVDGGLIGGASLKSEDFINIVNSY